MWEYPLCLRSRFEAFVQNLPKSVSHLFFDSVANIRGHLAAAVPQSDQILLLGPPYKVPKDSSLQSDEILKSLRLGDEEDDPTSTHSQTQKTLLVSSSSERSGSRRLFLFSKKDLSENAPKPEPCSLGPTELQLPTEAPGPSPLDFSQHPQQPLHQALAAYERQFMLYLTQGRVLADGADLRLGAVRKCVQEQAVMCRALRAAVSNLSDHFAAAARTRAEFSVTFTEKTSAHAKLLQQFDSILNNDLANVPLHPSLVAIAQASGRTMETLLDTVPVDRERAWAQQCNTAHQRLATLFRELDTAFGELGTTEDRQAEASQDLQAEKDVEALWAEVMGTATTICDAQAKRLEQLTAGHRDVVGVISNALNGDANELQNAFSPLQEMSTSSKDLVPNMIEDDKTLIALMERVSTSKTEAMKRMKVRLRDVSLAQSSIQRVLASVSVLRDALTQQTENMVHLEHVAELADSYQHFLSEIKRRRAYGQAVSSSSAAMMERLASMRDDEVKAREKFLRGPGRHLMPAFFDTFVPTLATPPPLFTPQLPAMVELDALPNIPETITMSGDPESGESGVSEMQQSASTRESDTPQVRRQSSSCAGEKQQDRLIVSADEASGTDLILDPADVATTAAADAEVKTLAYENAVLRQALERLGGKPPRTYIEESRGVVDQAEIAALRKELMLAKSKAKVAQEALRAAKASSIDGSGLSDKISHSSFEVGDVGLFMPTGRGSGGKRSYLAFHTNCPNRFLSPDCVEGSPDYVLGRIVYQEKLKAGETGTDANPYGLQLGTPFYVLTVEVLKPPAKP